MGLCFITGPFLDDATYINFQNQLTLYILQNQTSVKRPWRYRGRFGGVTMKIIFLQTCLFLNMIKNLPVYDSEPQITFKSKGLHPYHAVTSCCTIEVMVDDLEPDLCCVKFFCEIRVSK